MLVVGPPYTAVLFVREGSVMMMFFVRQWSRECVVPGVLSVQQHSLAAVVMEREWMCSVVFFLALCRWSRI